MIRRYGRSRVFIVIGGSSRTGTTLLSEFLSMDPQATNYLPECVPLQLLVEAFDRSRGVHFTPQFFAGGDPLEFYRESCQRFFDQIPIDRSQGRSLVLKCPTMTPFLGCLDELMPGGRYVVMVRDPRDIVTSQIKVARRQRERGIDPPNQLHASEDVPRMAVAVLRFYERLFREAVPRLGDRLLMLRYEDLTRDPEMAIDRLRQITGLALEHSPERADRDPWGGGYRTELSGGPISAANVGSFGQLLGGEQIAAIESICAPFMKIFGYEVGSSSDSRAFSDSMS